MRLLLTRLLNLPGIEVEDYHELGDELILEVEAIRACLKSSSKYGKWCRKYRQNNYDT